SFCSMSSRMLSGGSSPRARRLASSTSSAISTARSRKRVSRAMRSAMMRRSRSAREVSAATPAATAYSTGQLWFFSLTCSAVVADFDEVEAALFAVLVNRAGFERAGVEGPAFEFEALVRVAERDVVNERAKLFELLDGERGDGSVELTFDVRVQHQNVEEAL